MGKKNTYFYFDPETLDEFVVENLMHYGVPRSDAELAAQVLHYSDIHGIDSHGVARLEMYCWFLREKRYNPRPKIKIVKDRKSVTTIDGDNGLGLVVAPKAYQIALGKAAEYGSGWIALRNSNHYGAAGYYVCEALKANMIGMSMTHSSKVVTPLWGRERMLGTNPIAVSFPGLKEDPIVVDFATSTVAYGKAEIQYRKNEPLPEGWVIDKHGNHTARFEDFGDGACLLPLGSEKERGGHKGYGLASVVDILCGVLSGANWGPFVPPFAVGEEDNSEKVGKGLGQFMGAWDIESFMDSNEFKRQIDHWIRTIKSTKPMPGKERVLIPGEPEKMCRIQREKTGIPIIEAVRNDLHKISKMTGVVLGEPLEKVVISEEERSA